MDKTKKTEDMTEYFRNHREKNKDKLASYMTNYMKGYYDDRKDQFYEYNKKRREKKIHMHVWLSNKMVY